MARLKRCWWFFHCWHYIYHNEPGKGTTVWIMKQSKEFDTGCMRTPKSTIVRGGYEKECCRCARIKFFEADEFAGHSR